ncbi:MAG TPA: hypothetical protein VGO43_02240 [Pyrinomonadaceae bacterium]|jgi:hypothetical protein|nr:hypothetical protein [Pyrinomonadaceae bacterium]
MKIKAAASGLVLLAAIAAFVPTAAAQKSEFDQIGGHLRASYHAKKVHIPFMWLARAVVHIAKPAGVKSFNVTLYEDLKFSLESVDREMQAAMRSSFGPEWTSVFHVRSRDGQQAYMYMRESGNNVKIAVVTVEKEQAAVIRATISPERLASFINNPSVFGISLKSDDKDGPTPTPTEGN